jgi:hypothetical protein
VAALNNVELITALISCNRQLGLVGLQLRILNGVVSLLTTRVENKALAAYVSEHGPLSLPADLRRLGGSGSGVREKFTVYFPNRSRRSK